MVDYLSPIDIGLTPTVVPTSTQLDAAAVAIDGMINRLRGEVSALTFGVVADGVTDNSTTLRAAMDYAFANGKTLVLPAGTILASNLSSTALSGGTMLRIRGAGKKLTKIVGGAAKYLAKISGGASVWLSDLWCDTFLAVIALSANNGGTAYGILDATNCCFTGVLSSVFSDASVDTSGGIEEIRFVGNSCDGIAQSNGNGGALRIESTKVIGAVIAFNDIRNVGGASYTGKKAAIFFEAINVEPLSAILVTGNRIYNVANSDTNHCSGITVLAPRARVTDNWISTVQSAHASNVDTYAIYTKTSYATIRGNTILNAGGNAASIMTKGYPNDANGASNSADNDNVIADNVMLVNSRWALATYVGIATYNSGMDIHDNIIEGYNKGIVQVAPTYAENQRHLIHHNKIKGIVGTAAQSVYGIELSNPKDIVIEGNEFDGVGTGVETIARAISASFSGSLTLKGLTIRGNTIRSVSAGTSAAARGIAVDMDSGGTLSDVAVNDNFIDTSGRGVQLNFGGTVSGVEVSRNRMRSCATSTIAWGGTPPIGFSMEGNFVDGAPFPALISADNGNAAATLTHNSSAKTQRWATTLTADRAVALSTTGAITGAKFRIVREAAATGAFNLNVGTGPLKALTAGQWCDVEYNGSAWGLSAYGAL